MKIINIIADLWSPRGYNKKERQEYRISMGIAIVAISVTITALWAHDILTR